MKSLEQLANEGELFTSMESELVKQQLFDIIKDASIEARVGRQLVDVLKLSAGSSLDMVLADKDTMEFREVAEGAAIPIDAESYTKATITPAKFANRIIISQEIKEDANWDVMKKQLRQAGREAGVKEDSLIFTSFDNATYGFPSESNHDVSSAGAELAIADIVSAMYYVESEDYHPNVLAMNPEQVKELRQIDSFVEADKVGGRITFEKGFVGKIFGMESVITSSITAGKSYVIDTREAGVLVVKRPLTMKSFEIPERDALGVAVSFRAAARVVRPKAGARISIS